MTSKVSWSCILHPFHESELIVFLFVTYGVPSCLNNIYKISTTHTSLVRFPRLYVMTTLLTAASSMVATSGSWISGGGGGMRSRSAHKVPFFFISFPLWNLNIAHKHITVVYFKYCKTLPQFCTSYIKHRTDICHFSSQDSFVLTLWHSY